MLRKIVLGLTAAAALGASAIVPTAASAGGISIGFGGGGIGFHGHHGYHGGYYNSYYSPGYVVDYGPTCYFKKVKVYNPGPGPDWVWKKKKVCY